MKIAAQRGKDSFLVIKGDEIKVNYGFGEYFYLDRGPDGEFIVYQPQESFQATLKFGWWEEPDIDEETEAEIINAITAWEQTP